MKDYYEILGIAPDTPTEAVTDQYRLLALAWHPDRFPEAMKSRAEEMFKEINRAYEIIKDPTKRKAYDATRRSAAPPPPDQATAPAQQPPEWVDDWFNQPAANPDEPNEPLWMRNERERRIHQQEQIFKRQSGRGKK